MTDSTDQGRADYYLDEMLRALELDLPISLREMIDPWYAFEVGGDTFLDGAGKPRAFDNPCPWKDADRLIDRHFWVTEEAAEILEQAATQDPPVPRTLKGGARHQDTSFQLVLDHAVPLKTLWQHVQGDPRLHEKEALRAFLLEYYRRGILTCEQGDWLDTTTVDGLSLMEHVPHDWVGDRAPFFRYEFAGFQRRHFGRRPEYDL